MNIEALRTFLAVVQTGNLNRAADQLHVTQSTVSARLDALDSALGQPLLVRSRRGAQLTKAGFAFQRHAELMLQSWEQGRRAVGLPKGFSGLFSFACEPDLWEGVGADWLEVVRARHPDLALEAWPGEPAEIARWLKSGLVDAAATTESAFGADVGVRELARDRLVQVSTEPRPVQHWHPAYVYVDLGPEFRRWHSLTWPGDETAHRTFGFSRWALDYLLDKGGSAYLPWRLVKNLVAEGRLHPIEGAPEHERVLYLAWREASLTAYPWLAAEGVTVPAAPG